MEIFSAYTGPLRATVEGLLEGILQASYKVLAIQGGPGARHNAEALSAEVNVLGQAIGKEDRAYELALQLAYLANSRRYELHTNRAPILIYKDGVEEPLDDDHPHSGPIGDLYLDTLEALRGLFQERYPQSEYFAAERLAGRNTYREGDEGCDLPATDEQKQALLELGRQGCSDKGLAAMRHWLDQPHTRKEASDAIIQTRLWLKELEAEQERTERNRRHLPRRLKRAPALPAQRARILELGRQTMLSENHWKLIKNYAEHPKLTRGAAQQSIEGKEAILQAHADGWDSDDIYPHSKEAAQIRRLAKHAAITDEERRIIGFRLQWHFGGKMTKHKAALLVEQLERRIAAYEQGPAQLDLPLAAGG